MDIGYERSVRMVKKTLLIIFVLAASFRSQAYTNIAELINRPLTEEVLAGMPTNDYTDAQMTLLSFHRALCAGDFTNMYYCLSNDCIRRNMQVTNITEVDSRIIEDISSLKTNATVMIIAEVSPRLVSSNRYAVVIKDKEVKGSAASYDWMRYEIKRIDNFWKIDEWEELLPGEGD